MKSTLLLFIDIVLLVLISLIHYKPQWFFTLKSTTTTTPIPDTTTTTTTTVKPEDGVDATPAPKSYPDWFAPLVGLGGLSLALVFFIVGYVDEKRKKRIRANRTPEQKEYKDVLEKQEIPKILNSDFENSWTIANQKLDLMGKESKDYSSKRAKKFETALEQIEGFWKDKHTKSSFLEKDKEALISKLNKIVRTHELSQFKGKVWGGVYKRIEDLREQVRNTKQGDPI